MASSTKGRIQSRPNSQKNLGSNTVGLRRTGLETERDGFLYVPDSFNPRTPAPLVISLHGAGGDAHHGIQPFREFADQTGTILLAPESQGTTWDVLQGGASAGFGADIFFIDEALSDIFALYRIDPKRIAIAGFSDGASYALATGLANADLFSHIIAFSPGFSPLPQTASAPAIFISHGIKDDVLHIDDCSRKFVPKLKAAKLDVTYLEFDGGHTIPTQVGRSAFTWFLGEKAMRAASTAQIQSAEAGIEYT